jgi:hypothetical protein
MLAVLVSAGSLLTGCAATGPSNPDHSGVQTNGNSDAAVSSAADAGPSSANDSGASSAADYGSSIPTNGFDCSAAGIAAYADQLADKARTSCTQDGVGVVKQDDYSCMSSAINQVNPPYASASFNIVSTLLANNTQYPFYECTYFVQTVTTGVCNIAISPSSTPWTNYPFACSFINQPIQGYQWMDKSQGATVQVGDILLYTSSDGCNNDPGHIMIVVEVKDSSHFRVAEANELTSSGSPGNGNETGVVSNTRIQTLDDPYLASGWFRKN